MVDDPMNYIGNFALLNVGGKHTTRNSMSGGVLFLNDLHEEFARVTVDRSLIPSMVSGIIRFQTPLYHVRRAVTRDTEFRGQHMETINKVIL